MKTYDFILAAVVAFLLIKTLIATSLNGQVVIKGRMSGLFIGDLVIFIAICILVIFKQDQFMYPWLSPAGAAVFVLVNFLVKSGLAEGGLCYNGRRIAFNEMEFYSVEAVTKKNFRLRVHGFNKEYILVFPIDKREEVENRLKKAKVKVAHRVTAEERKAEREAMEKAEREEDNK